MDSHQEEHPGERGAGRTGRRRLLRYLLPAMAAGLLAFAGAAALVDAYGQKERARPAQAIVVLGARVIPGGVPGDSLRARTLHAVALYRRGLAPAILCTGGVGDFPPAEAQAAAALARQQGVPAAALFLESRSTSTWENALHAARICRAHGWRRVLLVSDPYHLFRARRDFERAGLSVHPSPAVGCERNRTPGRRAFWAGREVLLILRDLLVRRPAISRSRETPGQE